jgi:hypothetical protein
VVKHRGPAGRVLVFPFTCRISVALFDQQITDPFDAVEDGLPTTFMKNKTSFLVNLRFSAGLAFGLIIGAAGHWIATSLSPKAHAAETATRPQPTADAIEAELTAIKSKLPDQSHAMKDVGYHFANLWFAGQKKNWPLARFYLDETRSHLRWAVRIIPVRKVKAGDLELQGILDAIDNTFLSAVQKAIEEKDATKFANAYKQTTEGCYSCHKAAEKPYLRLQIPDRPEAPVINFDPAAAWPE